MDYIKIKVLYLILLLPNIIDFILTFLDYNDYKEYLDSENNVINYFIIKDCMYFIVYHLLAL